MRTFYTIEEERIYQVGLKGLGVKGWQAKEDKIMRRS